ncbi:hypothetical protein BOX15_Mlig010324g2, partial [Macrostomum lignano]
ETYVVEHKSTSFVETAAAQSVHRIAMVKGSNRPMVKILDEQPPLPLYPLESGSSTKHQQHHLPQSALQQRNVATYCPAPAPQLEQPDGASSQICYNSVNYFTDNPDAVPRRLLSCWCGEPIHLGEDWHTEICDGTVVCGGCSSCSRCGLTGHAANKRLVCIGGYVLCYLCIQHYGEPRGKAWRPKVVENLGKRRARWLTQRNTSAEGDGRRATTDGHNIAINVDRRITPDRRRVLRCRGHPRPKRRILPLQRDAANRMNRPSCRVQASGTKPRVVPASSAVCDSSCFRCSVCYWPLNVGSRLPGKHYVFCTCPTPVLWCNRPVCQRKRKEHHVEFKCKPEPVHTGGRGQGDSLDGPRAAEQQSPHGKKQSSSEVPGPNQLAKIRSIKLHLPVIARQLLESRKPLQLQSLIEPSD